MISILHCYGIGYRCNTDNLMKSLKNIFSLNFFKFSNTSLTMIDLSSNSKKMIL